MVPDKVSLSLGDHVRPFLIESAGVRGRLVRLNSVSAEILARHAYAPAVGALLAELLVMAAGFASLLKYDGIFTLQIKGSGPLKLMVADVTAAGVIRGYAEGDKEALAKLPPIDAAPVPHVLGSGYVAFTVDQPGLTERYQGIVELTGQTLGESLLHYFRQSEQLPTMVRSASRLKDGRWSASGLVLQRVPTEGGLERGEAPEGLEEEESWRRVSLLAATLKNEELDFHTLDDEALLWRLFNEEQVRVYPPRPLSDGCRCSQERIEGMLRQLGKESVEEMTVDDKVEVTCQFCNRLYHFSRQDAAKLF